MLQGCCCLLGAAEAAVVNASRSSFHCADEKVRSDVAFGGIDWTGRQDDWAS